MLNDSGQKLGNYQLIKRLGQGGFADVYLGEHVYLKTLAAIKVLQIRLTDDVFEQFLNEARTIARLTHPNIVRVLEFGIEFGTPFLVMNYASHGSIRQYHPIGSIISAETVISYVKQIAAALQYAHDRQIIHRDVKPENMLFENDYTIMLSDFGLAVTTQNPHDAVTRQSNNQQGTVGTVAYMAPEQFNGYSSPASDQYALGAVVYEWFCGTPPFVGPTNVSVAIQHIQAPPPPMREKNPPLDPAIEEVVLRSLAKDPQARYASIQEFAQTLENVCAPTQAMAFGAYTDTPYPLALAPFPPTPAIQIQRDGVHLHLPALPQSLPISRRTLVFGLAGLAALGITGIGIEAIARTISQAGNTTETSSTTGKKQIKPQPSPVPTTPPVILAAATRPIATSWGPGHLDLFVRGGDNSLWHRVNDGSWHPWEQLGGLGGALPFDASATAWGPGRLDLFARGADNSLEHKWFDGAWHDWESFGSSISADPSAASWGPERLDVFARGDDTAMWHRWFDGTAWHDWEPMGGVLSSAPAAAAGIAGQVHAFVRGSDTALWHKWFDGTAWHDWESLGGTFISDPSACANAQGRIDVFVRGTDNTLQHKWFDGATWQNWESLGGTLASAPGAVAWNGSRIDVFARSTDNTLQHIFFDGSWHPWEHFI